jgi:hypothetical protein
LKAKVSKGQKVRDIEGTIDFRNAGSEIASYKILPPLELGLDHD